MSTLRVTSDPELLVEKIERLLDEMRHMDRRSRQELHDEGIGEDDLLAMRALLDGPVRVRHQPASRTPQRSRR